MKRRIQSVFLTLVFVVTTTGAQVVSGLGVRAGVVAAEQSWQYQNDPKLKTNIRWGLTASLSLELFGREPISITSEIQYSQMGMKYLIEGSSAEIISLGPIIHYLSFPILVAYNSSYTEYAPCLFVGPRVDVLLFANGNGFSSGTDEFEPVDFGITAGVGFELPVGFDHRIILELRLNLSLTQSLNNEMWQVRNQTWGILIGVIL